MSIKPHVVPWYTPEQWAKVRAVCLDPDSMGPTFEDWLKSANELAEHEQSLGATVTKVYVDADRLAKWASRNGVDIISKNRVAFALDTVAGLA